MGNICNFQMVVKGSVADVAAFQEALAQEKDVWIGRGAEYDIEDKYIRKGVARATLYGWTKNSLTSSLVDNAISMREHPEGWTGGNKNTKYITLWEMCTQHHLDMEAYSSEPDCQFQEHLAFIDGKIVTNDCVSYYEHYTHDFNSKEEMEKEYDIIISDEEWADKDYIRRGGYENWSYQI